MVFETLGCVDQSYQFTINFRNLGNFLQRRHYLGLAVLVERNAVVVAVGSGGPLLKHLAMVLHGKEVSGPKLLLKY